VPTSPQSGIPNGAETARFRNLEVNQVTEEPEETENPTPTARPAHVRVGRLHTLRGARRELARLYSDLRNARVTPKVAGTSAYVIGQIIKSLEIEALDRLGALEKQLAIGGRERERRFIGHA